MKDYPYFAWPTIKLSAELLGVELEDLKRLLAPDVAIPFRIHPGDLYALNQMFDLVEPMLLAEMMLAHCPTRELYEQLTIILEKEATL